MERAAFARGARRAQARAALDRRRLVPRVPRDGPDELRRSVIADVHQRSLRSDPRRRGRSAGHQRALQPRRLADDRVSDARRANPRRRHVRPRRADGAACSRRSPRRSRRAPIERAARRQRRGERAAGRRDRRRTRSAARVFATFDEDHGGFGTEPKFPHDRSAPSRAGNLFCENRDPRSNG